MTETRDIGVAIGIPEPYGRELQGWREQLGDPNAKRIVPHVTLLPPTPVDPQTLPAIEEHLRSVAADELAFEIRLRGSATFLPVSPVVFVPLVQGISECERLE
jgi:2'-5' RNA ligase